MTTGRAVFLDLQGTLGGEGGGSILDFTFYPFAIPAVRLLNDSGLSAIVVTNQSAIAHGEFTLATFWQRMDALRHELAAQGARFDGVYCCPHTRADGCACKKPQPGMLVQAQRDFGLDLTQCAVVGDTGMPDMALARAAGCRAILVRTGWGEGSLGAYRATWAGVEPDHIAEDVLAAARWIVREEA